MSKIICPNCGSKNTCRIQYGYVALDEKLEKDLEADKVHLGGCVLSFDDPNRHCNDCEADFDTKPPDIIIPY